MDYSEILRLLKLHWKFLVFMGLLGSLVGSALSLTAQREYVANSQVFVVTSLGNSAADLAQGGNYSQQQAKNYSNIVKSELVLDPVIRALDLDHSTSSLARQISSTVPLNTSIISVSVTDNDPKRASQIANSVISSLSGRVAALSPTPVGGAASIRMEVIQSAVPPTIPSSPNVKVNVAVGIAIGVLLGAAFIVIRSKLNNTIRTSDQVRDITKATLLGRLDIVDTDENGLQVSSLMPTSSLNQERVKQIRTNLTFLQPSEEHKVLVFTSSVPNEGKSSVSANLALSLATLGKRVCLIDADLRKGTLAGMFDLDGTNGLTSVLSGQLELADVLQTWGPDQLTVLLAGEVPPNASELLSSRAMAETLNELRKAFDVTIIDTPPVLPVTDGVILGQHCNGVVMVVGAGRVTTTELRAGVDILQVSQTPILGTILNMAAPENHPHSQGHYGYGAEVSQASSVTEPA